MMKTFLLTLLISLPVMGQSSYSAADQDTQNNGVGTDLDSGYVNKDAENNEVDFSGEVSGTAAMPQNQEEPTELSSGKNATPKRPKTSLDD
jgi:hypothetical protein